MTFKEVHVGPAGDGDDGTVRGMTGLSQAQPGRLLVRSLFAALLLSLLAGCASIPLSTALRLSSWKARDLAQVDPAQVRVRLSVNEGFEVDIAKARLKIALTDSAGKAHEARLPLKLLLATHGSRPGGWFSSDVPVNTSVLSLTPEGAGQLRELQQLILAGDPRGFSFEVTAGFAKMPEDAEAITFWADLKLSEAEPYFALIDGADIPIQRN